MLPLVTFIFFKRMYLHVEWYIEKSYSLNHNFRNNQPMKINIFAILSITALSLHAGYVWAQVPVAPAATPAAAAGTTGAAAGVGAGAAAGAAVGTIATSTLLIGAAVASLAVVAATNSAGTTGTTR
jgi:MFS superfamily sulfate permease-like transporter